MPQVGRGRVMTGNVQRAMTDRFSVKYKVDAKTGCWVWTGSKQPSGYATLWNGARPEQGHRISYRMFCGDIPDGHEIDHVCRNRSCVNPDHLRAVSHRENMRCSDTVMGRNAAKSHCKRGHLLSGDNLKIIRGSRQCRECMNLRARISRRRRND